MSPILSPPWRRKLLEGFPWRRARVAAGARPVRAGEARGNLGWRGVSIGEAKRGEEAGAGGRSRARAPFPFAWPIFSRPGPRRRRGRGFVGCGSADKSPAGDRSGPQLCGAGRTLLSQSDGVLRRGPPPRGGRAPPRRHPPPGPQPHGHTHPRRPRRRRPHRPGPARPDVGAARNVLIYYRFNSDCYRFINHKPDVL